MDYEDYVFNLDEIEKQVYEQISFILLKKSSNEIQFELESQRIQIAIMDLLLENINNIKPYKLMVNVLLQQKSGRILHKNVAYCDIINDWTTTIKWPKDKKNEGIKDLECLVTINACCILKG